MTWKIAENFKDLFLELPELPLNSRNHQLWVPRSEDPRSGARTIDDSESRAVILEKSL